MISVVGLRTIFTSRNLGECRRFLRRGGLIKNDKDQWLAQGRSGKITYDDSTGQWVAFLQEDLDDLSSNGMGKN